MRRFWTFAAAVLAGAAAVAGAVGLYVALVTGDEAPVTLPSALRPGGQVQAPSSAPRRQELPAGTQGQAQIPIPRGNTTPTRPPAPVPQPLPESYGKWRVRCSLDIKSEETCRAEQVVRDENGQPQLALVVHPAGQAMSGRLEIVPPWGISIEAGVGIQIDAGAAIRTPLVSCQPGGCEAVLSMPEQFLASFLRGTEMKVTVISAEGQPLSTTVPLAGLADAYQRLTERR